MRLTPMLLGFGLTLGLGLASCAPPPPPPPTVVNLTLKASTDANASPGGQGSPVAIRVYQLASPAGFEGAEFFPLFEHDTATLKDDIVKRDDYLLSPGQTRRVTLMPEDRVHAIGVFAAYRAYGTATWRADTPVPPHQTTDVTVTVGGSAVTITAAPAKPPS